MLHRRSVSRPRLNPEASLTEQVAVRLTVAERAKLEALIASQEKAMGLPAGSVPLAAYIRGLILDQFERQIGRTAKRGKRGPATAK